MEDNSYKSKQINIYLVDSNKDRNLGEVTGLVNMIMDVAEINGNMNADIVCGALERSTKRILGPSYMKPGMGDGGGSYFFDDSKYDDKIIDGLRVSSLTESS